MTSSNGHHNGHASDEAIDALYAWFPPQKAPQPLPEAAFSITLRGKLGGQEALLTARGMTAEEFRRNLESITGLLDPVSQAPVSQGKDFCKVHQVQMKEHTNDKGSWFSHFVDGRHCKGK